MKFIDPIFVHISISQFELIALMGGSGESVESGTEACTRVMQPSTVIYVDKVEPITVKPMASIV